MLYKVYLFDFSPESFTLFKWCLYYLTNKKNLGVLALTTEVLSAHLDSVNPLVGRVFSKIQQVEKDVSSLIKEFLKDVADGKPAIAVTSTGLDIFDDENLPILFAEEIGNKIETGFKIIPYEIEFDPVTVEKAIEEVINSKSLKYETRKENVDSSIKEKENEGLIEFGREMPTIMNITPKFYFAASEGIMKTPPGTGLGNLCKHTISIIVEACSKLGYSLVLLGEEYIPQVKLSKSDRLMMYSMNGLYMGGTTVTGQGVKLRTLLDMAKLNTEVPPTIVSSLHPGEVQLYGKLTKSEIRDLSNIRVSCFNKDGLTYLRDLGLNTTNETWPIPIDLKLLGLDKNRSTPKEKEKNEVNILFQMDAQHRKNGEYILPMLLDSINIARKDNPNLNINITAKATAPHSLMSESVTKDIVEKLGLSYPDPFENVLIKYEMRTPAKHWKDTLDNTDIGLFLSTEEGLHMFVVEAWLTGINCIVSEPGCYPSFDRLGEGITTIPTQPVPSGGTGLYNDFYYTTTKFPNYRDGVKKIKDAILNLRHQKARIPLTEDVICISHIPLSKLMGMQYTGITKVGLKILDDRSKPWVNHVIG